MLRNCCWRLHIEKFLFVISASLHEFLLISFLLWRKPLQLFDNQLIDGFRKLIDLSHPIRFSFVSAFSLFPTGRSRSSWRLVLSLFQQNFVKPFALRALLAPVFVASLLLSFVCPFFLCLLWSLPYVNCVDASVTKVYDLGLEPLYFDWLNVFSIVLVRGVRPAFLKLLQACFFRSFFFSGSPVGGLPLSVVVHDFPINFQGINFLWRKLLQPQIHDFSQLYLCEIALFLWLLWTQLGSFFENQLAFFIEGPLVVSVIQLDHRLA